MGEVRYMISEAAKRVNMEAHVLRHWEEELELTIGRTEMGHRYYTEEDIRLFNCIKELKEQGMLLKELKEIIPDMQKTRAKLQEKKRTDSEISEKPLSELQQALLENNEILQKEITQSVIKEIGYLFLAQEQQEEERYKRLDHLIRQQQSYRKELARSTPLRQLRKIFEG
jgi:DNA-binding transcriptional MerR regulator